MNKNEPTIIRLSKEQLDACHRLNLNTEKDICEYVNANGLDGLYQFVGNPDQTKRSESYLIYPAARDLEPENLAKKPSEIADNFLLVLNYIFANKRFAESQNNLTSVATLENSYKFFSEIIYKLQDLSKECKIRSDRFIWDSRVYAYSQLSLEAKNVAASLKAAANKTYRRLGKGALELNPSVDSDEETK